METSPVAGGSWRAPRPLAPSVDTSDDLYYLDTTGTKPRDARELERSADLFAHKLRQVERNKKEEEIKNPRARESFRGSVSRRAEREVDTNSPMFFIKLKRLNSYHKKWS